MNTIWSNKIQGIDTLFYSRQLRFDDYFRNQYLALFNLDKKANLKILEIGCGPGALALSLAKWYPNAQIVAIDRDSNFINYAKKLNTNITFMEADATALPFADNSFDVTISNTVSEHIDPKLFYSEQQRVLKDNGICLVLSARKGIVHEADCLKTTKEEETFWSKYQSNVFDKYNIGKYSANERELPMIMGNNGFKDISCGYVVCDLNIDDSKYNRDMALRIIEAKRLEAIECLKSTKDQDADKIIDIVNKKYDKRLELYNNNIKQWDTYTSITMIIRGVK